MSKVKLGDKVRDRVTGYEGTVIGITNWLNGCARLGVQGQERNENGMPNDAYWFDEFQAEIIKEKETKKGSTATGGPRKDAMRSQDPRQ